MKTQCRAASAVAIVALALNLLACGGASGGAPSGDPSAAGPPTTPQPSVYTATAQATPGGHITPSQQSATDGEGLVFTVHPAPGYQLTTITGCDGSLNGDQFTTASLTADCAINAEFALKKHTISSLSGNGGRLLPATTVIEHGQPVALNIELESGYSLVSISGCEGTLLDTTYTIAAAVDSCTVTATFAAKAPTIVQFNVSPAHIKPGDAVTIRAVYENGQGYIDGIGAIASGQTLALGEVTKSTTYALTVTGVDGQTARAHQRVFGFRRLATNQTQLLALKDDGTVWSWGNGYMGGSDPESHSTPVQIPLPAAAIEIALSDRHGLALTDQGEVWAWGLHYYSPTGANPFTLSKAPTPITHLNNVVAIAAGGTSSASSFAIKADGTLWSWGSNLYGELGVGPGDVKLVPTVVPNITDVAEVFSADSTTYAIDGQGALWAWGRNDVGQLGNGTTEPHNTPQRIDGLQSIVSVGKLGSYAIALDSNARAWAWGRQSVDNQLTPIALALPLSAVQISSHLRHAFFLDVDNRAWSWGNNTDGQGGLGAVSVALESPTLLPALADVAEIVTTGSAAVALFSDGSLGTWGNNAYGQSADASQLIQPTPRLIPNMAAIQLAAGDSHSLALMPDGRVMTWGGRVDNPFGNGQLQNRSLPRLVPALDGVQDIDAGWLVNSAVKSDGTLWSWGQGVSGGLGNGQTTSSYTNPVQATDLFGIEQIARGDHLLAVDGAGSLYSFGRNDWGQVGNGTTHDQLIGQKVAGLPAIRSVSQGYGFSVAADADGRVWAWGFNNQGQLGDGTTGHQLAPQQVPGLSSVIRVAAGDSFALALKNDGTVWAWGGNSSGELGDNSTSPSKHPQRIDGLHNIQKIHAARGHGFAIDADGTLWGWGSNCHGMLNAQNTGRQLTPHRIDHFPHVTQVAAGSCHILVKADDQVYSWGADTDGQLGLGRTLYYSAPQVVDSLRLW